jgi:hypothetical protein
MTQLANLITQQPFTVLLLALATYRLSRLIAIDVIFEWLRNAVWKKFPPSTTIGYLFTCVWCQSIWFGSLLTFWYTIEPASAVVFTLPLALSAVAGIITARVD